MKYARFAHGPVISRNSFDCWLSKYQSSLLLYSSVVTRMSRILISGFDKHKIIRYVMLVTGDKIHVHLPFTSRCVFQAFLFYFLLEIRYMRTCRSLRAVFTKLILVLYILLGMKYMSTCRSLRAVFSKLILMLYQLKKESRLLLWYMAVISVNKCNP